MKKEWVITIGREFCSGGAEIAHKVANQLNLPYYDKNIIDQTAEILELSTEVVKAHDEKPVRFWDVSGYQYSNLWYSEDPSLLLPLSYRIADAQFKLILRKAKEGACVIVGRCADYALREQPNVLNVFIRAELSVRMQRAMRLYGITEAEAKKLIVRTDKIRKSYYDTHTQQSWGSPQQYQLVLDSGKLGTDAAADLIAHYVESFSPSPVTL